jgi:hypothetical protein
MDATESRARRIRLLHAVVRGLVTVGLLFLLIPFVGSIPWPRDELPADATLVETPPFPAGETRRITLLDGSEAWVTRASPALAGRLRATPADRLWSPSAPGLADQDWFVLAARSSVEAPVRHLPASGAWPGGFVADDGSAWDLAGRALKPWPGHPSGRARTVQHLPPLPWREVDGQLVLRPMPAAPTAPPP